MIKCNLCMSDACYGCPYYGVGDIEGCKLTIEFNKKYPIHTDKEYRKWMLSNNRIEITNKND